MPAGVPTPEIYVLDHEAGINAFAAGFSTEDAAIAVTRGTLEMLNREELQGVIAHEFSHIFNGDMRLNIQLMGPIFGILALGFLGRLLLRSPRGVTRTNSKSGGGASSRIVLVPDYMITGYVGLFLARLIKAGVSRQREYLADASAVQFTRQRTGIAGALKKIAGYHEHSAIADSEVEEVSHMLFASGFSSITGLLATHPPLLKRIQALEPEFSAAQFDRLHTEAGKIEPTTERVAGLSGLTGMASDTRSAVGITPGTLLRTVGNPLEPHYEVARNFAAELPTVIVDALESSYQVMLLLPALLLHRTGERRARQIALLDQQLGSNRRAHIEKLNGAIEEMSGESRLPILNLALPLIKEQPPGRLAYLSSLLEQLAMLDNRIDVFEYALLRIYQQYMRFAIEPATKRNWRHLAHKDMTAAAMELLSVFAAQSNSSTEEAAAAYARGIAILDARPVAPGSGSWVTRLDNALAKLQNCMPRDRERLLAALMATALHDGQINKTESELLRAFCAILECPLPPVVDAR